MLVNALEVKKMGRSRDSQGGACNGDTCHGDSRHGDTGHGILKIKWAQAGIPRGARVTVTRVTVTRVTVTRGTEF